MVLDVIFLSIFSVSNKTTRRAAEGKFNGPPPKWTFASDRKEDNKNTTPKFNGFAPERKDACKTYPFLLGRLGHFFRG